MIDCWLLWFNIRRPFLTTWSKWQHRHETPEERQQRIKRVRQEHLAIWQETKKEWESVPEDRTLMEAKRIMDDAFQIVFGSKDQP